MTWTVTFDIVLAILLMVAIYYCWRLSGYLRVIRDSKSDLAQTIYEFNDATNKAQKSIIDLKNASNIIADKLQVKIEKSEFMADDLAYLIERANKTNRKLSDKLPEDERTVDTKHKPSPKIPDRSPLIDPSKRPGRKKSGIEELADQSSSKRSNKTRGKDDDDGDDDDGGGKGRSKAEQELLKALKSIR